MSVIERYRAAAAKMREMEKAAKALMPEGPPWQARIGTHGCAGIAGLVPRWHPEFQAGHTFFSPEDARLICASRNLLPALLDTGDALAGTPCNCPHLIQCPHCSGEVTEGRDQFYGSWICGRCVKTIELPKDSTQPCKRCAALIALTDALEKELGENNGS